tara:strand:- start:201 stop:401 length:201 start_codon:yes stop_codon:yes gene_type:complete
MEVLMATQEQYDALNKYQYKDSRLEFCKDANDNWIVGISVLKDSDFSEIQSQLQELEVIDYAQPEE